jgi:hypothetical protein
MSLKTPEKIRSLQRKLYVKVKAGYPAVCLATKPVGEPDAGNPHVRFDEKGWETEPRYAGLRRRTERFSSKPPATYRHRAQSLLYRR